MAVKKSSKKKLHKGKATVSKKHSAGPQEQTQEEVKGLVSEGAVSFVGVKLGRTINIGEYESVKVEVFLTHPSDISEEALDDAFEFAKGWCDDRIDGLVKEVEAAFAAD